MVDSKRALLKGLSLRADALRRAMESVMNGTTPDHGKWGAFKSFARAYDVIARKYAQTTGDTNIRTYNIDKIGTSGSTVWPVQKEIFDMVFADTLTLSALLAEFDYGQSASVSTVQDMLVANLRKAVFSKPEREIEIQNAIEALLVGRGFQKGLHYDREAGKLKFSGKEFIPDFVFHEFSLAIEVKLIKENGSVSKCVEEMSADAVAYSSVYNNVLFCVYDLGEIRDVSEVQGGLEQHGGTRVCVIKH